MHLSGSLKAVSSILTLCDKNGWSIVMNEMENGNIFIYTPWQTWTITRGGAVITTKI